MKQLRPGDWTVFVASDANSLRLDSFLAQTFTELSRARAQKLILDQQVKVNDSFTKSNYQVQEGDQIAVYFPAPTSSLLVPQDIPLHILFQDEHLAVIEKPAGLVVHPAAGHADGTLVNALLHHIGDLAQGGGIGGELRPGIVHRIDRQTSGVLLITKTDQAHRALTVQFKEHSISRRYLGLAWGKLPESGEWNAPIGRDPKERKRMAIVPTGRHAITQFRKLGDYGDQLSAFEATLLTGRTHQIRVHFSAHGFPLVGDPVYVPAYRSGRQKRDLAMRTLLKRYPELAAKVITLEESGRQFLHAAHLGFTHPATGARLEFTSNLPPDLEAIMVALEACKVSR